MKMKFWDVKSWGSLKVIRGQPNSLLLFCISIEDLEEERDFSELDKKRDIVRRTTFFAIKNYCLPVGERLVGLSNVMLWIEER